MQSFGHRDKCLNVTWLEEISLQDLSLGSAEGVPGAPKDPSAWLLEQTVQLMLVILLFIVTDCGLILICDVGMKGGTSFQVLPAIRHFACPGTFHSGAASPTSLDVASDTQMDHKVSASGRFQQKVFHYVTQVSPCTCGRIIRTQPGSRLC